MKNFLKVTCKYQKISSIYDILEAYGNYSRKQKGILKAVLTYVTKPEEAQKEKMEDFLRREFGAKEIILTLREDKSLIGASFFLPETKSSTGVSADVITI